MGDGEGEEVGVPRLGAEIVPVLASHAQRSGFAEAWHTLQSERYELRDLGSEGVRGVSGEWQGWVWVCG